MNLRVTALESHADPIGRDYRQGRPSRSLACAVLLNKSLPSSTSERIRLLGCGRHGFLAMWLWRRANLARRLQQQTNLHPFYRRAAQGAMGVPSRRSACVSLAKMAHAPGTQGARIQRRICAYTVKSILNLHARGARGGSFHTYRCRRDCARTIRGRVAFLSQGR
jgi:hypothetical protein